MHINFKYLNYTLILSFTHLVISAKIPAPSALARATCTVAQVSKDVLRPSTSSMAFKTSLAMLRGNSAISRVILAMSLVMQVNSIKCSLQSQIRTFLNLPSVIDHIVIRFFKLVYYVCYDCFSSIHLK